MHFFNHIFKWLASKKKKTPAIDFETSGQKNRRIVINPVAGGFLRITNLFKLTRHVNYLLTFWKNNAINI
jgi:hypothetical protein